MARAGVAIRPRPVQALAAGVRALAAGRVVLPDPAPKPKALRAGAGPDRGRARVIDPRVKAPAAGRIELVPTGARTGRRAAEPKRTSARGSRLTAP